MMLAQFFCDVAKRNSMCGSKVDVPPPADAPKWLFGGPIRTVAQ
jgi:hypothetical protein